MKLILAILLLPSISSFLVGNNNLRITPPVSSSNLFFADMPSCKTTNEKTMKKLFPFKEARRIARGHGFTTKEEFLEYCCPGAYQLPKNADQVWAEEWTSWEDFLGICHDFQTGRTIARTLNITSSEEYLALFKEKKLNDDDSASRLPYRPDLKYKEEWKGWNDWLCKPKAIPYDVE